MTTANWIWIANVTRFAEFWFHGANWRTLQDETGIFNIQPIQPGRMLTLDPQFLSREAKRIQMRFCERFEVESASELLYPRGEK